MLYIYARHIAFFFIAAFWEYILLHAFISAVPVDRMPRHSPPCLHGDIPCWTDIQRFCLICAAILVRLYALRCYRLLLLWWRTAPGLAEELAENCRIWRGRRYIRTGEVYWSRFSACWAATSPSSPPPAGPAYAACSACSSPGTGWPT